MYSKYEGVRSDLADTHTWLRAFAADMTSLKGLSNHCQVTVAAAGAEAIRVGPS